MVFLRRGGVISYYKHVVWPSLMQSVVFGAKTHIVITHFQMTIGYTFKSYIKPGNGQCPTVIFDALSYHFHLSFYDVKYNIKALSNCCNISNVHVCTNSIKKMDCHWTWIFYGPHYKKIASQVTMAIHNSQTPYVPTIPSNFQVLNEWHSNHAANLLWRWTLF